MPQPNVNSVHVDAILTNISVAYLQNQNNFIADKVFPIVPVDKKSDKFFTYTKNDWFRDEAQRRADATESAGSGYNLSTDTYSADVWAFHKDVGDQTVANADAPLNPLREATEFVTRRLLLPRNYSLLATSSPLVYGVQTLLVFQAHHLQVRQSSGQITHHLIRSMTSKKQRAKSFQVQVWKQTLLFLDTKYSVN